MPLPSIASRTFRYISGEKSSTLSWAVGKSRSRTVRRALSGSSSAYTINPKRIALFSSAEDNFCAQVASAATAAEIARNSRRFKIPSVTCHPRRRLQEGLIISSALVAEFYFQAHRQYRQTLLVCAFQQIACSPS